jgi:uncharacterized protein YecE (DUF72 family)
MPRETTVLNWADSVGNDFRFTFKLSKTITHAKGLEFTAADILLFIETINKIGNKAGCILIQFPPGLKVDKFEQVSKLIAGIKASDPKQDWQIAIEFRNTSWYHQEMFDLLDQHNISLVIHDLPASQTPLIDSPVKLKYLRFHGPGGRYRGSYTDEFLLEYAQRISGWISEGNTVYCYFNNTMGDAVKNLETLNRLVRL